MGKYRFYLDGSYLSATKDVLDLFTPGYQCFHGVFETMRAAGGNVEFLDEHMVRMMRGLKRLKISHLLTISGIKAVVRRVVKENPMDGATRVRVMVFSLGGKIHYLVMALPYEGATKKVLRVCAIRTRRPAHAKNAQVKSLEYGLFADAHTKALAQGYDEALLLNAQGYVFEASRANVFICTQGALVTPPLSSGCLDGIIRRQVIALAQKLKVPVFEKNLTLRMIASADHAFLTNSLAGLTRFDYN